MALTRAANFAGTDGPVDALPPHNTEAEQAVLGSLLLDAQAIHTITDILQPQHCYHRAHELILGAMLAITATGMPVDLVTLSDYLTIHRQLDTVGGLSYLSGLVLATPTSTHVAWYARIVRRCATLRDLIRLSAQVAMTGYDTRNDAAAAVREVEKLIAGIDLHGLEPAPIHDLSALLDAYYARLVELAEAEHSEPLMGIGTGFTDLDALMGGLHAGDLCIIAARPRVGKSAIAINIARHIGSQGQHPILFFSAEMSREQVTHRLVSSESHVPGHRLQLGQLSEDEWLAVTRAVAALREYPIQIDDTAEITLPLLATRTRRWHRHVGSGGVVMVDYLQLIKAPAENRVQEVSQVARGMKALARELQVPVVVLSQLSRAVEHRPLRVPMLSDLRETGELEQVADQVVFIVREELDDPDTPRRGLADLHLAKNRNGPSGKITLGWQDYRTTFVNLSRMSDDE